MQFQIPLTIIFSEAGEKRFNEPGFITIICVYFGTNLILVGAYYKVKHVYKKRKRRSYNLVHSNASTFSSHPNVSHTYVPTNQEAAVHESNSPVVTRIEANQPESSSETSSHIVQSDSFIRDYGSK